MKSFLKISDVARQTGIGVDAIRYYERRGVLPRASRRASGYRQFTDATVERIRFTKKLQALGFSLDEVVAMLASIDAGRATCASERFRVEKVLGRVDEQIATLMRLRDGLTQTLSHCRAGACTLVKRAT